MQQSYTPNFLKFIEGTLLLCIYVGIDERANQCTYNFYYYNIDLQIFVKPIMG